VNLRRNPVARRNSDGSYRLLLNKQIRSALDGLLGELEDLLFSEPDDPSLARLHPTAYTDDPDRDAEYQLLAGDELRSKRRQAIDTVRSSLAADELTEAQMWAWLQALNSLRLVVGTRLDVDDDDGPVEVEADSPDRGLWEIYEFSTQIQGYLVRALDS